MMHPGFGFQIWYHLDSLPRRRAKGSVRFRPYDLVVVQRTKVEAEYFTVSATGVMRLRRGVQVCVLGLVPPWGRVLECEVVPDCSMAALGSA